MDYRNELVVIPCYHRIEMLGLALEAIDRSIDPPDDIRIFADTKTNIDDVEYVRDTYLPHAMIFQAGPHIECRSGFWNILHSIKSGYETGADKIYLIEEDIIIQPDLFAWHRMNQSPDIIATCGRNLDIRPHPSGTKIWTYYSNPGSCLIRDKLDKIVPHINDDLFKDSRKYLEGLWGPMDGTSVLDDGLIQRYAVYHNLPARYPDKRKLSHIGFHAYNHYMDWINPGKTIDKKIECLRKMLPKVDPGQPWTRDFEPLLD